MEPRSPIIEFPSPLTNSPSLPKPEYSVIMRNPDQIDKISYGKNWIIKILIAGPAGVGKTALVERFCTGKCVIDQKKKDKDEFSMIDVTLDTGGSCRMQIHIVKFQSSLSEYCRAAAGALLCFDLTDNETFRGLPTWLKPIQEGAGQIPIMLVGTKWDLPNHTVDLQTVEKYATLTKCEAGAAFCSAKNNQNVNEIFNAIAKWALYRIIQSLRTPKSITI